MRIIGKLPPKKGKGKLTLFCGNGEQVISIYGGAVIMVVEDLNANIKEPEGNRRDKATLAALLDAVLEDVYGQFLPHQTPWARDGCTWNMIRKGRVLRSCVDYIIRTYLRLFRNVSIRYPRKNKDHCMVLGCLHGAACREKK